MKLLLILALAFGSYLRIHSLSEQILADDEWHTLRAAFHMRFVSIASHFGESDYCIPLAIYDKILLKTTGLSEIPMRVPVLFSGIISLVLLPLLIRPLIGKGESILFAWLLAVAPMHVYYSRYARPYGIALLFGFIGVIAAYRWLTGGSRRWAVLFVIGSALGLYFHLTVLPLVILPFLFFAAESLFRNRGATVRRWGEVIKLGLATGLGTALLIAPPLLRDIHSLSGKAGSAAALPWSSVRLALDYWISADRTSVLLIMGLFILAGVFRMAGRIPRFLWYLACLAALQVLFLLILQPLLLHHPYILARYGMVLMPIALLLASTGIGGMEELLRKSFNRLPPGSLAPPAAMLLFVFGPLMPVYAGPNNWTNHGLFQYQYEAELRRQYTWSVIARKIPDFYRELGKQKPGSTRILEAPWFYEWGNNPYPAYQQVHKQWMAIGFVASPDERVREDEYPLNNPGFRFRNYVYVGNEGEIRRRGIRYAVFHRNLAAEIPRPIDKPPVDMEPWIERYQSAYGNPIFDDSQIVVFDLERKAGDDKGYGSLFK